MSKIGSWAFIAGLIIAVIAGLAKSDQLGSLVALVLVLIGIIVGFLNVTEKEATPFLVAAIALLATGSAASMGAITLLDLGARLTAALDAIAVFVAPAAIIVAVKQIYGLARD